MRWVYRFVPRLTGRFESAEMGLQSCQLPVQSRDRPLVFNRALYCKLTGDTQLGQLSGEFTEGIHNRLIELILLMGQRSHVPRRRHPIPHATKSDYPRAYDGSRRNERYFGDCLFSMKLAQDPVTIDVIHLI